MKLSRYLLIGLIIMTVGLSSVFAGGQDEAAVPSEGGMSGTLRVQFIGNFKMEDTTDPISGAKTVGVHYLKEEFEKLYPGVDVEFILMGWNSYTQKTQTMLQADEVDVVQVPGIALLADQGLLEPLQSYINKENFDLNIYMDNQVEGWMAMGPEDTDLSIYGLPFIADTRVIIYDKLLFDQWGVEYLSWQPTPEELYEKGKAMTGTNPVTGEQNYGLIFKGAKYTSLTALGVAEHLGGTWGTGFRYSEMTVNFNSPEMVAGVEWMKSIIPFCPPGVMSRQGGEKQLTEENDIAINLHYGPGFLKVVEAIGLEDRIGVSSLWVHPELGVGGIFQGSPVAISSSSAVKDIAWEWLKFTATDTYMQYFWDQYYSVPPIKSAMDWDSMDNIPQIKPTIATVATLWAPRYPYRAAQVGRIFEQGVEEAVLSDDVKAVMDQVQADSEAWFKDQ
jgi:multiple sugar transport system substrate-binding protein